MQARAATCLDANAGTPLSENVRAKLLSFLCDTRAGAPGYAPGAPARSLFQGPGEFLLANPSSAHSAGRRAKALLRQARAQVAASLGAARHPEAFLFTSSGTEACQAAIRAVLEPRVLAGDAPHWILTAGDHDAHQQMIPWLEARGGSASLLPLRTDGAPDVEALAELLRPETALVSAIWVNNETGVISDVEALSQACRRRDIPLHLDAAQAWGKLAIDLGGDLAQLVSFSGHKIGALAGTGALWVSPSLPLRMAPVFPGHQEGGLRGGTENLLGLVSLGEAATALDPARWSAHVSPLRDRLEREILRRIPGARIHGSGARRVGNTSNFGFESIERDGLVMALDLAGFCVSSGSACSSGITEPSHVLCAMGVGRDSARAAVRVSLSAGNSEAEIDAFVGALERAVAKMRGTSA